MQLVKATPEEYDQVRGFYHSLIDEMQAAAATKKYTSARLRRAAWFGMLGVTETGEAILNRWRESL